jgi:hypothetical protein
MSQARLLDRIRREFQEHPGIALTLPQARRLWSLDDRTSAEAFDALIAEGFLQRVGDLHFWAEAPVPRFRRRGAERQESAQPTNCPVGAGVRR